MLLNKDFGFSNMASDWPGAVRVQVCSVQPIITGDLTKLPSIGADIEPRKAMLIFYLVMFHVCNQQAVEQTIETPVIWDAIALIITSL